MAVEIERKFLVEGDAWRVEAGSGQRFCQGYLAAGRTYTVRVRRAGQRAFVAIKGPRSGISRPEFEYEIPIIDAEEMLAGLDARHLVEKTRYRVAHFGAVWEIDEYGGRHTGLVIAEIELEHPDSAVALPAWIGREVTFDRRYRNSAIAGFGGRFGASADNDDHGEQGAGDESV